MDLRTEFSHGKILHQAPMVLTADDFLTEEECGHIIELAKPKMKESLVSAAKGGVKSEGRSGKTCWLDHSVTDKTKTIASKVADLVDLPLGHAESFQVIYYGETQEYRPHFDAFDVSTERGKRCTKVGGQRMITCLIYLNTVDEGGGTTFPKLNISVQAKIGRLTVFHNCKNGSTSRDPLSIHGGMPVISGEKWACNLWFREKSFR